MLDFKDSKNYLTKALRALPQKDKTASIKTSILKVLNEIEYIEKKSVKTERNVKAFDEEWRKKISSIALNLNNPQASLEAIDKMIEQENQKRSDMEKNKNSASDNVIID